METTRPQLAIAGARASRPPSRPRWPRSAGFIPALVALLAGCVAPEKFVHRAAAPTGSVCQAAVTWSNRVNYIPDPANGGIPTPGLAGRLYLFGANGLALAGDGAVVIDLYDDTPRGQSQPPQGDQRASVPVEQWRIDRDTLGRLLVEDSVGWGYTLFLPWGTYRRDVSQVHMAVRFEPTHGTPIYAPGGPLTLDHGATPPGGAHAGQGARRGGGAIAARGPAPGGQ